MENVHIENGILENSIHLRSNQKNLITCFNTKSVRKFVTQNKIIPPFNHSLVLLLWAPRQ